MAYEVKPNSGSLFVNNRKERDQDADRTGSIKVTCPHCGVESDHWLNGWLKVSEKVGNWLSLRSKAKQGPKEMRPIKQALDDEIPF